MTHWRYRLAIHGLQRGKARTIDSIVSCAVELEISGHTLDGTQIRIYNFMLSEKNDDLMRLKPNQDWLKEVAKANGAPVKLEVESWQIEEKGPYYGTWESKE